MLVTMVFVHRRYSIRLVIHRQNVLGGLHCVGISLRVFVLTFGCDSEMEIKRNGSYQVKQNKRCT